MPSAICSFGFVISSAFLLVNNERTWAAVLIIAAFICALDVIFDSAQREVQKDKTP